MILHVYRWELLIYYIENILARRRMWSLTHTAYIRVQINKQYQFSGGH